jgi:hypothetical protein
LKQINLAAGEHPDANRRKKIATDPQKHKHSKDSQWAHKAIQEERKKEKTMPSEDEGNKKHF